MAEVKPQRKLIVERDALGNWVRTECSGGVVLPGLVIAVDVEESFWGSVDGLVEVHVGYERLLYWDPRPLSAGVEGGELEWSPHDAVGSIGAIEVGQAIGIAAHYVPSYDAWSVMGELMFSFEQSGEGRATTYVQNSTCDSEALSERLEGLGVEELRSEVRGCENADGVVVAAAAARRDLMWRAWGPTGPYDDGRGSPANYVASKCLAGGRGAEVPACASDDDCSLGRCVGGACLDLP